MAYYGSSGARAGLTCPHCGETQVRPLSGAAAVLYCRKCGKSFTRRMGEGIHRRSPKKKAQVSTIGVPGLLAKRPSMLPAAPPPTALRKPSGKA